MPWNSQTANRARFPNKLAPNEGSAERGRMSGLMKLDIESVVGAVRFQYSLISYLLAFTPTLCWCY